MTHDMIVKSALAFLLLANLTSFFLMAHDKRAARKGRWRVPERTLFFSALLFGGLGGTLGMLLLRHKTRHWYFRFGFPLILLAQAALLALAARRWL